ncbi:nucleoside deaminase [Methylocystis sp. IM3]|uniref:nucleoside deaminase n=1 Tax=unclassified Methylocystis TaxID=2625913 RepID=UPI002682A9B5
MESKPCDCGCGRVWDRREMLAGFACVGVGSAVAAAAPAHAEAILQPVRTQDDAFMRLALDEAANGDLPFGAVIVLGGKVVARGRNIGDKTNDPTAHGEMTAIRRFIADRPAADLQGATLYTTGEPCPMCMGAILWCGFARLVYAASIAELETRIGQIMLTSRAIAGAAPFAHIEITGGVLAKEALALFR